MEIKVQIGRIYRLILFILKNMSAGPALGGVGPNWGQFRSVQVPIQLAPSSVELGVGPNWEQLV